MTPSRPAPLPRAALLAGAALLSGWAAPAAQAQTAASAWADSITISGYIQAGITGAPGQGRAARGLNFGHAFTDKANQVLLNQAVLTIARDIDKTSPTYDVGFRLQGMFGS